MQLRRYLRILVYTVFALLLKFNSTMAGSKPISEAEAYQVIERLLSLPHGTKFAVSEDRDLVSVMVEQPEAFLPLLSAKIESLGPTAPGPLDADRIVHSVRVLGLIAEFGPKLAGELINLNLRAAFRRVDDLRAVLPTRIDESEKVNICAVLSSLNLFCRFALDKLAEFGNGEAINEVVVRLSKADLDLQTVLFRYLEKVAPFQPDVRPKLEEMYNSPDSPLRNNPQLLRVLEAINKAEAERRLKRPRDDENERERNDDE